MEKVKKETIASHRGHATISDEVSDHSNDPFVQKKVAKAKEMLSKTDLSILKEKATDHK